MSKLTRKDVLHVAKLAKLTLSEAEISKFLPQLSKILEYVKKLNEVDTKDVKPTAQVTGLKNISRKDMIKPENYLSQEEVLSGSENVYNGYFKTKAILEGRSDK